MMSSDDQIILLGHPGVHLLLFQRGVIAALLNIIITINIIIQNVIIIAKKRNLITVDRYEPDQTQSVSEPHVRAMAISSHLRPEDFFVLDFFGDY